MNSDMVKPDKIGCLYVVYHFTVLSQVNQPLYLTRGYIIMLMVCVVVCLCVCVSVCVLIFFHREDFFQLPDVQDMLESCESTILCCEYSPRCFWQIPSSLSLNLSYFISKDVNSARRKTGKKIQ